MNKGKYLNDILTEWESDDIITNKLVNLTLEDIGGKQFILQHANINKLNMQVIKNILTGGVDAIMQKFCDRERIKPLIEELFTISIFKTFIYPAIKSKLAQLSSMKSYFILYHEACVINLLENFFFNVTACEAAEDYIVDIIEYCYRMLTKYLNSSKQYDTIVENKKSVKEELMNIERRINENPEEELNEKESEIEYSIAMCSINILRYISDHLQKLPFPVSHHMMNVKDIPLLFVTVMERKPWLRTKINEKKEEINEVFENNQWIKKDENKLPKLEGQVWITLYNLLMNVDNNKKYEITNYRQNQILRLRKYFSTTLYDLIPNMTSLYRSVEEMSLMNYGNSLTVNPFIVEMIPQLTKSFKLSEEQIKKIGQHIIKNHFEISKEAMRDELAPINDVYNVDNIEYFMEDPKCAGCGKDASNRCSRCKTEWYCGKECQVKRWKLHKEICKTLADLNKDANDDKKKKDMLISNPRKPEPKSINNPQNDTITSIKDSEIKETIKITEIPIQAQPQLPVKELDELD